MTHRPFAARPPGRRGPVPRVELAHLGDLEARLAAGQGLARCVVKGLDLRGSVWSARLTAVDLAEVAFLGCRLDAEVLARAHASGAVVFPPIDGLPFDPYRTTLYTPDELYDRPGEYAACLDARIDEWFLANRPPDVLAALYQRLHDHAISDALVEAVRGRRVVGIMGGHDAARGGTAYASVAALGRDLTRRGLFVATGGGPGAMEAANLGAYAAPLGGDFLDDALARLAVAPDVGDRDRWLRAAWAVRATVPAREAAGESVGIPTWFYGHEPPNPFASASAKYFENSVREDGLLTLADAGIIFTPGSAGTVQEVFQDATANHYAPRPELVSPMVFLGVLYWTEVLPVVPLLRRLARGRAYADRLLVTDDVAEAAAFVDQHRSGPT